MINKRVIPVLLLLDQSLVKTIKFSHKQYIGDPCNTIKIFNEFQVDEVIILDIGATKLRKDPNLSLLKELSSQCFMPIAYGGGVKDLSTAGRIFDSGFEKIVVNSGAITNHKLIKELSKTYGRQAVIFSLDYRKHLFGKRSAFTNSGDTKVRKDIIDILLEAESQGAGEVMLTNINREGTWKGLDLEFINIVSETLSIPVIANGGVGSLSHIRAALIDTYISAVGVSSFFLFQKKGMGVLINVPSEILKLGNTN